jgi:L-ascorbate metabolism protein UlaG (beta-lactamase superfamily)
VRIRFVNHASFVVEHGGVSLLTDPWLEGRVFHRGWDLVSPTTFAWDEFRGARFLWFSHEHPDHFHPPTLAKIPADLRREITVLFQETPDKRVVGHCRGLGFKDVVELRKGAPLRLGDDFEVRCERFHEGDSWMSVRAGGVTVLNTNDCGIRNARHAQRIARTVGPVDVLLTQFSYAYWAGNPEDTAKRRRIADEKLAWMKFQCDAFRPKVTIPIASFVWFCHEENAYLNDSVNTAEKTHRFLAANTSTSPVVLYPGDEYEFPQAWDSAPAIARYREDFERVVANEGALSRTSPVPVEEVTDAARRFTEELRRTSGAVLRRVLADAKVHLRDHGRTFTLSLASGLTETAHDPEACDVSLGSESLLLCLRVPWGLDTTQISGRLRKPPRGRYARFYNFFRPGQLRSRGEEMDLAYLAGAAGRKLLVRLGLYEV